MMWAKKSTTRLFIFFSIIFILLGLGSTAAGTLLNARPQTKTGEKPSLPPAENFSVKKAASKIKIDGVLNEEAWKYPHKIDSFYEWIPGDNITPPVKTECFVTYDKSNFYVAFRCFDPEPAGIRAHIMDRDSIDTFIQDDYVSIMIDTFNDERRGFQFRVNALGVQADAILSEMEGYEDFSWDAIWNSAGKITDFGYVVEMAIPFNQLRFPKTDGVQTWGFSASRSYPRSVRHRMSSHVRDRNKSCIICQYNKITGIEGISPGKNIELIPTITMMRTDTRQDFPSGDMADGKIEVEPGISGRWGITPNLMLNATINPDFSQVEADVAQLEVNTRFVLRYPEKRPFFLESADFFLTPIEAVFTRTVSNPYWGAKVSGKIGKNAVGVFVTRDSVNNLVLPANQGSGSVSLEDDTLGGVFRYRRDVGKGSTLGLLYTGRTGDDYFNHVAGLDGYFRLSRSNTLTVQYLNSRTDYPDAMAAAYGQEPGTFNGNALSTRFDHRSRNWICMLSYEDYSPGFRSDFGYVPRVDFRKFNVRINPIIWGKKDDWFDRLGFMVWFRNTTDRQNNLTDRSLFFTASYTGPLQSYVESSFYFNKQVVNGTPFTMNLWEFYATAKPAGGIDAFFYTTIGDSIDYANSREAKSLLFNSGIEFGCGRHLNVNITHTFQRLSFKNNKIFSANLLQSRFIYNLNVRTFVRAIIQYYNIHQNPGLYIDPVNPKTQTLFTQFLFSYKLNPQTVLFLGYSDNHLGLQSIDLTRRNRTFFLKIGYALVM